MNKAVAKICPSCKTTTWVGIPIEAYEEWNMGICLQKAWPEGSATERETLISGLCPECQKKVFEEEEDEDVGQCEDEGSGD